MSKRILIIITLLIICSGVLNFFPAKAFNIIEDDLTVRQGILNTMDYGSYWVLMFQQLGVFLFVVLLILMIFCFVGMHSTYKYISANNKKLNKKIRLIFKFLFQEPAKVFAFHAPRDRKGTYQISFAKIKKFQTIAQKNLFRLIGIVFIIIIIVLIISFTLNHDTQAQDVTFSALENII